MTPGLGAAVTRPGYDILDRIAGGRSIVVQERVLSASEQSPISGATIAHPRPTGRAERRARLRQLVLLVEPSASVATLLRETLAACGLDVVTMSAAPSGGVAHDLSADALLINEDQLEAEPAAIDPIRYGGRFRLMIYRARRTSSRVVFFLDPQSAPSEPLTAQALGRRVRARMRPFQPAHTTATIEAGPLRVDSAGHRVYVSGAEVVLTALEFRLLVAILTGTGHVLSREALLNEVWGIRRDVDTRTVDAHVKRLRRKLGEGGKTIETVRGFGYRVTGPASVDFSPSAVTGRD